MFIKQKQAGLSLVELVIFIVIMSIGVVGITRAITSTVIKSSDPLIRKQALVIAESLMEEITLQPFTYCDPSDANFLTAANGAGCATAGNNQSVLGPTSGETRYSTTTPFDNVGDYSGFTMASGIIGIDGNAITELANYNASVAMTQVGITQFGLADATAVIQIVVTVTVGQESVSLTSHRFRFDTNNSP
jgi:MSHA pilin protein MshD